MSPDGDPGRPEDDDGREMDEYEDEPARSIFSALWFRALLAVLVLGVLAAVAVPYVLDVATTPAMKPTAAKPATATPPAAATSPAPATEAPTATAAVPAPITAAPVTAEPATVAPVSPMPPAPSAPTPAPPRARSAPGAAVTKSAAAVVKVAESPKQSAKAPAAAKASPAKAASASSGGGSYWVQVGAFKDASRARRLAARLREQGLQVEESTTTPVAARAGDPARGTSASDRYDVVVSGASAADLGARLAPKGMTGETTPNGVVVRPSLALRDAVALSRELADAGLSIQVRRVGGPPPSPTPASGDALHRVRVGSFPDRAAAAAAMKQLEDKGFKAFIARGTE